MTRSDRWQDVKRITADALERPAHERAAFLDQVCTDPDLRAQVEQLLSSCEQADAADGFLREPAPVFAAALVGHVDGSPSGTTSEAPAELRSALGDRYTMGRELGRGGMAVVYLARDERHHRDVAVKVVHQDLATVVGSSSGARRFQREIEIAAQLNHPHIVPLYDSGAASGHLYYIMPFVDGESLRGRLTRGGRLSIDEAMRLLRDLARALAHAHRHGVVHRDIKPENILLNRDGDALVVDFGVAKALAVAVGPDQRGAQQTLSAIGLVLGTPAYMAPEQALGDAETDHRADLYALGLVAYEVLAGAPPFSGRSARELTAAHLTEPPRPIEAVRPDVPPALASLVMRLLEKAPAERPQDATQVLRAIEGVPNVSDQPAVPRRTPSRARAPTKILLAVAASLILVAGALLRTYWRSHPGIPPSPFIAVIPFVSTSGNADDEPFTDGLTDEVIAALSRGSLNVIGRTTAFALKDKNLTVEAIARMLHVNVIVEGTVRRDGERLKVATQLLDARDSRVMWSDTYDRDRHDVFAVQEQIARDIATALSVRLTGTDAPTRLAKGPTEDFEAYQLYLKGRYFFNLRRRDELHRAVQYFIEATRRDSSFARAYAGLADTYSVLGALGFERPHDVFPKARAAAERAIALDPKLGEAHGALAHVLFTYEWNWKAAEEAFRTAIALDPKYPQVRIAYAAFLQGQDRGEEALAQLHVIREVDPLASTGPMSGRVYVNSHRPDEAIRDLLEALELNPRAELAIQLLGHAYLQKGMNDQAIAEFRRAAALNGVRDSAHLAYGYAVTGHRADAKRLIETLVASDPSRYLPPFHIALAYAGLGDKDAAFRWLERAYDERASFMDGIKVTPGFDVLHSDPRYAALLKRMNY
ncbi:MAG TPA: protein kinase [Gemmatimonadaceae bacterium]|nr:protein kinase [Gemmatimonadaceae bacterium]